MTFENKVSNWKRALKPQLLRQLEHKTHFILPAHAWSQPCYKYYYNYSFKIFRRLWLAQIKPPVNSSKAIGVNLTKFGTAIYHRFDDTFAWKRGRSMVSLPGNEAAWVIDYRTKKMAFTAIQRQHSWISS